MDTRLCDKRKKERAQGEQAQRACDVTLYTQEELPPTRSSRTIFFCYLISDNDEYCVLPLQRAYEEIKHCGAYKVIVH